MVGRTELIIDLATKFPKKAVLGFLGLRQEIYQLQKKISN